MDDVLRVRAAPGAGSPVAGSLPPYATGVRRAPGEEQEVDGTLWLPIYHGELAGWVNSDYLAIQAGEADEALAARAAEVILALRDRDLVRLSSAVHPSRGVRFSPYTYVRVETESPQAAHLAFQASEVASLLDDPTVYRWGTFDGSGEPMDMTFAAYYDRFVYDVDFSQPERVGFDVTLGQGNTINNIAEVYPEASTVEYHFGGFDPAYAGMDWRSLRLVFVQEGSAWYLVGIVHDEWTI
jgi:hypothetical protein